MSSMPRAAAFDSTLQLIRDPYRFISRRCKQLNTEVFYTRILLQPTICMTGAKAAELFYNPDHFVRNGAAPEFLQATLFGKGGVQGLDGAAHQHRKALFLYLLAPQQLTRLMHEVTNCWPEASAQWQKRGTIVLYDEIQLLLTKAVCRWAGISVPQEELPLRTQQLVSLFDEAGSIKHFRSRQARKKAEEWLSGLINDVRNRKTDPDESALSIIAYHRELDGSLLPLTVAAVELLNLLRPIIAASVFVVFVAHAIHEFPFCREPLAAGDGRFQEWFIQEVRRYYPFFPAVAARVREDFEWEGFRFKSGCRTLLDLYGTNHDPNLWENPEQFHPERFSHEKITAFNHIPQGGGNVQIHHRCPGEAVVMAIMKVSIDFLVNQLAYKIPPQDLRINMHRLPALPCSRFVMTDVTSRQ